MNQKVTMKDLSQQSGYSVATISRVFNGSGYPVKKETHRAVLEWAHTLGYVHKKQNRTVRWEDSQNLNNVIGIVVPTISNQHYTLLLQGIEECATKYNFNMMLCNVNREPQKEIDFIQSMLQKRIQGIIIASTTGNSSVLRKYQEKNNFVVAVEQDINLDCDKINYNYLKSGFIAAEYLADLGHKHIAFFSSPITRHSRSELQKGFVAGLRSKGYSNDCISLYISENEREFPDQVYEHYNGKYLVRQMLDRAKSEGHSQLPTAIFCINDMTAIGAIQQLQKDGFHVPRDISVMGFDNIPFTRMVTPEITTIDQSSYDLGYISCETLIKKLNGETENNISLSFEPTLIQRESTQQCKQCP